MDEPVLNRQELEAIMNSAILLHGPEDIRSALDRMAAEISTRMAGRFPVVLCILNGGIIPTGHLLTRLAFPLETDYLHASRYRGRTTGESVQWVCEPETSLRGRDVLLVDDILDEGHTLKAIEDHCREGGAASVLSAVLVQKRHARLAPGVTADFVGLEVEDRYVFGFGMDYKGYLRNLDGIYALAT